MVNKRKQSGVTLPEMTVVIGIIALLVGLTIPAVNMLLNSFESESGAKSMITAALASARAIAAKEQRYAGIRFQKRYDPNIPDILNASQYIIFIINETNRLLSDNLSNGFRAVEGIQPIKLPDSIGVMDLFYNPALVGATPDMSYTDADVLRDTTTFSLVFSPSGKLVTHRVRARNRNGDNLPVTPLQSGYDDIFNSYFNIINNGLGMFVQDDYPPDGLDEEPSRSGFVIYETKKFKQAFNKGSPWTGYLQSVSLKPVYINPYTGTIVEQ